MSLFRSFRISHRRLALAVTVSLAAWLFGVAGSQALALAQDASPDFRLIVHASNPQRAADRAFLADAFLKKTTRWEGGETIRPVDLRPAATPRKSFTERVLKRSVGAVRSYWQQRIFSGRDVPPPELDSDDEVLVFVAKYPGAVGYVSGAAKLKGVKELAVK
jgi:ABC-type phosphate transport system substrate-binding protein